MIERSRGRTGPDLILSSQEDYGAYMAATESIQRITDGGGMVAKLGFPSLKFYGAGKSMDIVLEARHSGCPLCLQEDAQATPGHPERFMAMRGDWLLRSVNLCCHHHHPLVPLWEVAKPAERFDSAARLCDLAPRIMAGAFDRPCSAPTDYDLWLDMRLETGEDPTWLAGHGVYAVTTICAFFGMALLQHRSPEASIGDRREAEAQAAGFAVLSQGEAAFRQALWDLARSSGGTQIAPRQTFGKLYVALDDYLTDAAFDPFRTMLRDCILETWPVAAGERVLGEVLLSAAPAYPQNGGE